MTPPITVCIPTISIRTGMLARAVASVHAQTLPADALAIAHDHRHEGVWRTRQRALDMVRTPLVANLDDDDEWMPHHLERLYGCMADSGADVVFSYFESAPVAGFDPLGKFGVPFDPARPHLTTSVILARTDLVREVGYDHPPAADEVNANDDHRMMMGLVGLDAKIVHHPERTWFWWIGHGHTSGQPKRW